MCGIWRPAGAMRCFNGATLVGAWKAASPLAAVSSSPWLQRSHARGSVEGRQAGARFLLLFLASTEPRSWERGRWRRRCQGRWCRIGFNGATLVGAWKVPSIRVWSCPCHGLQRSHARGSVEGSWLITSEFAPFNASTEPRSWERGRAPRGTRSTAPAHASTEPRSWERGRTAKQFRPLLPRGSFNGATLVGAWKAAAVGTVAAALVLQRSHARGSVEGNLHSEARPFGRIASTEPRSWERGRAYWPNTKAAAFALLQRSHARGSVEGKHLSK